MALERADIVVCGAGIAGIAAAYHLSKRERFKRILLVDREPPLSVTSDKSTECYRNWWPAPGTEMVELVDSSIAQLESIARATGNRINLNRRGYLFASAHPDRAAEFGEAALSAAGRGVGELREFSINSPNGSYLPGVQCAFDEAIDGCDLITDPRLIKEHFPCLSGDTRALLHVRRCGWMSAQQLGAHLLEVSRSQGVEWRRAELREINLNRNGVNGVVLSVGEHTQLVETSVLVNAAGPFFRGIGDLVGLDLPVFCEAHVKLSFQDVGAAVDRTAPLIIWTDPTELPWSEAERDALSADEAARGLLNTFPAGVHGRPDGMGDTMLLYWPYHCDPVTPVFPVEWESSYPEIVLRGMSVMVPALAQYFERMPGLYLDGGYYTKTAENRPLVGPLPVPGMYAMGAFSGFGIMAALGAGELLTQHICGDALPSYAARFTLARYADPHYQALLEDWPDSGQL